jgi:CPA2 family monovalent cation:H+ antiporter-2
MMNDYEIIRDILLILAVSIATVYLLRKLQIPVIAGFIIAGVLIGPGGFGLVDNQEDIEIIAEIGVALLLFTIGLRFSFRELAQMKWLSLGAGGLQVVTTIAATSLIMNRFFGMAPRNALMIGFLVAVSSTAIVLRMLEKRGETYTVHGRFMVGILIFQDLAVIPLILLTIFMGSGDAGSWADALLTMGEAIGLLAALLIVSRFLFPWFMEQVVHTRSREVFTLSVILIALGTAYLGARIGFSLAMGAFLAGVVMSESDYSHQVLADITPFRDVFYSLFFVSIGMLVDPGLWISDPTSTLGAAAAVLILKAVVVAAIALLFGFGGWVAVVAGMGLAQVGEFSFVLASTGLDNGLLTDDNYAIFISVSVLTMAFTPLIVRLAPVVAVRLPREMRLARLLGGYGGRARVRFGRWLGVETVESGIGDIEEHVVIVGYGVNGRNVARMLRQIDVEYIVLELNPHTVMKMRQEGEKIYYGDAVRREVLQHAGVERARSLVIAVADPSQSRQMVVSARALNPALNIIVRTRFLSEVEDLYQLGADQVVPEEFETSLELAGKVMSIYGAPSRVVSEEKNSIRNEHYSFLSHDDHRHERSRSLDSLISAEDLREVAIVTGMAAMGRSIMELALRTKTGATVVAIERTTERIFNPTPEFVFVEGDVVFLLGTLSELNAAETMLSGEGMTPLHE